MGADEHLDRLVGSARRRVQDEEAAAQERLERERQAETARAAEAEAQRREDEQRRQLLTKFAERAKAAGIRTGELTMLVRSWRTRFGGTKQKGDLISVHTGIRGWSLTCSGTAFVDTTGQPWGQRRWHAGHYNGEPDWSHLLKKHQHFDSVVWVYGFGTLSTFHAGTTIYDWDVPDRGVKDIPLDVALGDFLVRGARLTCGDC